MGVEAGTGRRQVIAIGVVALIAFIALGATLYPFPTIEELRRELILGQKCRISGRVTGPDGKGIPGLRVLAEPFSVWMLRMVSPIHTDTYTYTRWDGTYVIRGLLQGDYVVSLPSHGEEYILEGGKSARLTGHSASIVDFVAELGPEVLVRVVDAESGVPIPGVGIVIAADNGELMRRQETNEKGEARRRVGSLGVYAEVVRAGKFFTLESPSGRMLREYRRLSRVQPVEIEFLVIDHRPDSLERE